MKPDVLNKCTSGTALKELDLTIKDNMLSQRKLNIGFATELTITEMIRKNLVTAMQGFLSLRNSLKFATAEILFEKSPLGSMIVTHAGCVDPKQFESNVLESAMLLLR